MAACGVVKSGPVYAGGVEPVEPVVPGEPVVGDAVGAGELAAGAGELAAGAGEVAAGAGGLAATTAAVVCRGRAPVAFAWCGDAEAQADARIIKPAAPASGMSRRVERVKRCMASPFC
jgi:X-X-X-Leu-X-X-Gly heptad repeat protein